MASYADRVLEGTTTTGTGTYSLSGAVAGHQTFVAGVGNAATVYYMVTDGTDWEVGVGTVTDSSPDTLSRDTILDSSNAGSAVNWAGGAKSVALVLPADRILDTDHTSLTDPHTQYLRNNASDTTSGTLTAAGFTTTGTVSTDNLVLTGYIQEQTYTIPGNTIDADNGTMQYKSLTANWTPTISLNNGESVYLRIANGDTYSISWASVTWTDEDNPPILSASCAVVLWQENSTVYGSFVGTFV